MSAILDRDVVLPGVGVWHPRTRWLEGDASRMVDMNIKQSVQRLTVRVHKPEDLQEMLKGPKVSELEEITIEYIKGFSFHGLRNALSTANMDPEKLKLFRVIGNVDGIRPWQLEEFGKLYRCLSGATLEICGQTAIPGLVRHDDEVVREENLGLDQWYRRVGGLIATDGKSLPWFMDRIKDHKPTELALDCDDQFLLMNELPATVQVLRLYNVMTTLTIFCEFLRFLKLPRLKEFHMTTNDHALGFERVHALKLWFTKLPHLQGVGFWNNGVRLA